MTMYPPTGVFRGTNPVTPHVLSYYKLARGWAELSEGCGFEGERIYGVTVRRHDGERFEPDPSKLCFSRAEALVYIAGLQRRGEP